MRVAGTEESRGHFPASLIEHHTNYRLILRRSIPASPSTPEPNSMIVPGSGTLLRYSEPMASSLLPLISTTVKSRVVICHGSLTPMTIALLSPFELETPASDQQSELLFP